MAPVFALADRQADHIVAGFADRSGHRPFGRAGEFDLRLAGLDLAHRLPFSDRQRGPGNQLNPI